MVKTEKESDEKVMKIKNNEQKVMKRKWKEVVKRPENIEVDILI